MKSRLYDTVIEYCLIFLIIFTPLANGTVKPWSIAVFELTALIMLLALLLKYIHSGKFVFVRNPLLLCMALFVLYVCFQLLMPSGLPSASIYKHATKTAFLKLVSYLTIFFVLLQTIKTKAQITRIISWMVGTGFVMSIFFLMRYFGASAPRGIVNPDHFAGYLGMIIPLAIGFFLHGKLHSKSRFKTYQNFYLNLLF